MRPRPSRATHLLHTAPRHKSNFYEAKCNRQSAARVPRQHKIAGPPRQNSSTRSRVKYLRRIGRRGRGKAASCAPSETHQHLHMIGLWENVKQINAFDLEWPGAGVTVRAYELRKIAGQGRRVAGNVVNPRGSELLEVSERFGFHTGSRRIDDHQIGSLMPPRKKSFRRDVARRRR